MYNIRKTPSPEHQLFRFLIGGGERRPRQSHQIRFNGVVVSRVHLAQMLNQRFNVAADAISVAQLVAQNTGETAILKVTLHHKPRIKLVIDWFTVAIYIGYMNSQSPVILRVDWDVHAANGAIAVVLRLECWAQGSAGYLQLLAVATEEVRCWRRERFHLVRSEWQGVLPGVVR